MLETSISTKKIHMSEDFSTWAALSTKNITAPLH